MKNRYALLLLLVAATIIFTAAMNHPDAEKRAVSVSLNNMNVFYEGVDNPITIQVDGVKPESIVFSISHASFKHTDVAGKYIINATGTKSELQVGYKENGLTVWCDTFYFRVKKLQDPVTYVNHVRNDGVILKEDLQKITGVFTRLENCDFDGRFTPQSFSMSVIEEGEWKEYTATGPELTDEMKAALKKCEENDKIIFHNVMTKGPAGDVRHVNCVTITVK